MVTCPVVVAIDTAPQGGGDVVSMGFNDVPKATDGMGQLQVLHLIITWQSESQRLGQLLELLMVHTICPQEDEESCLN